MRFFDADKGTIIRRGIESPSGANGGRAAAMERKVFNAALDLLKDEDEELGKMISTAIDASAKKTGAQIDTLRSAIKSLEKDDAPAREVMDGLKTLQQKAKDSQRELLEFIEKTGEYVAESVTGAVADIKPTEMKEHPRIKSLTPVRGSDGKIKRVDVNY